MFYQCPNVYCNYIVDVLCALQTIKILHRSHQHRLTVIKGLASFTCGACGTQHDHDQSVKPAGLSYLCNTCGFWIHPDCASLPNAIQLHPKKHRHALLLIYNLPSGSDHSAGSSKQAYKCALCEGDARGIGVYFCGQCHYYAHIKCAIMTDPPSFDRVLIRNAKLAGLRHLPMVNENISVMRHLVDNNITSEGKLSKESLHQHTLLLHDDQDGGDDHPGQSSRVCNACTQLISSPFYSCSDCPDFYLHDCCANLPSEIEHPAHKQHKLVFSTKAPNNITSEGKLSKESLHQHTLLLHDDQDGGDDHPGQSSRVCNACTQLISSPFYSCSDCPDFYLHDCCANLPSEIEHPAHKQHKLVFSTKAPNSSLSGIFLCDGCRCSSNRFAYSCKSCNFTLDVVCALMPPSITYESHGKTHILTMSYRDSSRTCTCCKDYLTGIWYKCSNCGGLKLHVKCALIPNTTKHIFDEHLLKLTTDHDHHHRDSEKVQQLCQICENNIQSEWCYGCTKCEQLFHYGCIPSVNDLSRIKLGATIKIPCHDCPLSLILESSVCGYLCGYCHQTFSPGLIHQPAYECSNCYFRIHEYCAEECLLKKQGSM